MLNPRPTLNVKLHQLDSKRAVAHNHYGSAVAQAMKHVCDFDDSASMQLPGSLSALSLSTQPIGTTAQDTRHLFS
jgi:hypothetical protein